MSVAEFPIKNESKTPGHAEQRCPRCKSSQNWGMASWCPGCGYYPAIDGKREDAGSWADNMETVSPEAVSDGHQPLLKAIDSWIWVMIAGIVGILLMSILVKSMYDEAGLRPGAWSWGQLLLGLCMMTGGHAAAAVYAMKKDRRLNFGDVLTGWIAIWQPTISALPKGHRKIWSFVWGITLTGASLLLIGDHNFSQLFAVEATVQEDEEEGKAFGKIVGKSAEIAKKNGRKAASLEESLENLSEENEVQASLTKPEELQAGEKECFGEIFGYLPGLSGKPTRVFICSMSQGRNQYVGRIFAEEIRPEALQLIAMKVVGQECKRPYVACDAQAIWVRPVARCRIRYSGIAEDGTFRSLQLVSVIRDSVDPPDSSVAVAQGSPLPTARTR